MNKMVEKNRQLRILGDVHIHDFEILNICLFTNMFISSIKFDPESPKPAMSTNVIPVLSHVTVSGLKVSD